MGHRVIWRKETRYKCVNYYIAYMYEVLKGKEKLQKYFTLLQFLNLFLKLFARKCVSLLIPYLINLQKHGMKYHTHYSEFENLNSTDKYQNKFYMF